MYEQKDKDDRMRDEKDPSWDEDSVQREIIPYIFDAWEWVKPFSTVQDRYCWSLASCWEAKWKYGFSSEKSSLIGDFRRVLQEKSVGSKVRGKTGVSTSGGRSDSVS
jgi:hypothetical protein